MISLRVFKLIVMQLIQLEEMLMAENKKLRIANLVTVICLWITVAFMTYITIRHYQRGESDAKQELLTTIAFICIALVMTGRDLWKSSS